MTGTLRDAFDDLASAVRPVDLTPRVTAGVRRRRRRRLTALTALAATSAGFAVAAFLVVTRPAPDTTEVVVTPPPPTTAGRTDVLTESSVPGLPAEALDGDLSPDGRRLAYWSEQRLVLLTPDGMERVVHDVPVTDDPGYGVNVVWSPDARTVAVVEESSAVPGPGVAGGLHLVDASTGRTASLSYPHRGGGLSWSPDGTRIAVVTPDGAIDVVTRTGSLVRRLTFDTPTELASDHAWSPDGTRLLVQVREDRTTVVGPGTAYVAVVSATTGEETGRLWPSRGPFVWRDAGHVACECDFGVVTEHTLDGEVTRTLFRDEDATSVLVRPAS